MSAIGIAAQRLLNDQRQARIALAHVGMAGDEPDPRVRRDRDHRRNALTTRTKAEASTSAPTMILSPVESVISIRPMVSGADESAIAGVDVIVTGKIAGGEPPTPSEQ